MKIQDKIEEIEKYLAELASILPSDFTEYSRDIKTKAACERYFEKITEAIVDLSFLIIKGKNLRIPEEDTEAFEILEKEGIISEVLSQRLKDAKGMRNILAHQYGVVDDEIVFTSITEELEKDTEAFLEIVKKMVKG